MHGALTHDLPGIVGRCGGVHACATCHCGTGSIHHNGYKPLTAEAETAMRAMLAANPQLHHHLGHHLSKASEPAVLATIAAVRGKLLEDISQRKKAACTSLSTYIDNGYGTAQQHLAADSIGFDGFPGKAAKLALWV